MMAVAVEDASNQQKQHCIILKTDAKTNRGSRNQQNAIAGGIWFLNDLVLDPNNKEMVVLKSTVNNLHHMQTSVDNVKKITEREYQFLITLKPKLRLKLLANPVFSDLLDIKVYDKITVAFTGQEQTQECIVYYIGPLDSQRGYYFGVVFETEVGDTDGSINDKLYFNAKPKHGRFLTIDQIFSVSKCKKRTEMSSFNSLQDTGKKSGPKNTLKRRTKSQILLLDLAAESERIASSHVLARNGDTLGLLVDSRVVFFEESGIPLHGTIKFIGSKYDDITLIGVELDSRITEPDGNFKNGIKVFDCPRHKGLIARPEELIKEDDFNLMMRDKEMPSKIIIDEPFYNAGDLDENMNAINDATPQEKYSTKKKRAKSSVGEEHFSCPICLDIVDEAVETTCCHQIFCEHCIRKHRETTCPKCRTQPYTIIISHFVRKLVGNFYVECSNEGCFDIVSRSELKYHKAKCPYEVIRCPHDGCKIQVAREKMDEHKKTCGFCLVTCLNKGCLLRVARKDLEEHGKFCDHALITCNNKGCTEKTKRMKLAEHQREICKFMTVKCPVPNCKFQDVGIKLGGHLAEEHYELFIRHLHELKDIYSKDDKIGIYTVKWVSLT